MERRERTGPISVLGSLIVFTLDWFLCHLNSPPQTPYGAAQGSPWPRYILLTQSLSGSQHSQGSLAATGKLGSSHIILGSILKIRPQAQNFSPNSKSLEKKKKVTTNNPKAKVLPFFILILHQYQTRNLLNVQKGFYFRPKEQMTSSNS